MSGATFDTLQFAETLEEAGIPENQARAISKAVRNAYDTAELVTKTDLREAMSELRADLRTELQTFRGEIQTELQTFRGEIQTELQAFRGEMQTDLQTVRMDLQSQILRLDSKVEQLDSKVDKLGLQLTVRLGGLVVVALGAFATLSKWTA